MNSKNGLNSKNGVNSKNGEMGAGRLSCTFLDQIQDYLERGSKKQPQSASMHHVACGSL